MRICLVSRELAPFFGAGIGTYVSNAAKAFAAQGHEVHVLTGDHRGLFVKGPELRPGVTFHLYDFSVGDPALNAFPSWVMRHAMAVYRSLKPLHERFRFDYIEFPDYWGEGHFALQGKKLLGQFEDAVLGVRLHTPTRDCRELNRTAWFGFEDAYVDHQEETALRNADLLLSPTHSLLKNVRARVGGSQPEAVVPYPFDVDAVIPELGEPVKNPPANGRQRIVYVGRLERRKGVHLLVEAAQRLMEEGLDLEVRFLGGDTPTGPMGHSMHGFLQKRIAPELADRFDFTGGRPRNTLGSELASATVCCFPSLWENFPNVCLEAMSIGATVVGSDAGGMAEIIEHEKSGLVFESGNVDALTATLKRALGDAKLRSRIAVEAPKRIRSYCDEKSVVEQTVAAVEAARKKTKPKKLKALSATPAVSFLVPFYNLGAYLPETLESIRAQTFTNHEIIVVDDGSTDGASLDLLEQIEKNGVQVVRKRNGGLSSARNAGLKVARGRWVLPLDADDLIAPDFLEKTVSAIRRNPDAVMVTSLVKYFSSAETPAASRQGWVPWGLEPDVLAAMNIASTCTALIERERLVEVGGYDEWLTSYEDWDLYCTFAERGWQAEVIPEFLFFYRWRPDSLSRTEVEAKRYELRAYLLEKHARLAKNPDRTQRFMLADTAEAMRRLVDAEKWNLKRVVDRTDVLTKLKDSVPETIRQPVRNRVMGWLR